MATVNKNFRIKHGLVVEGTTGTIDGNTILTETASDQYILDLIGGETLVKSVSGNLSVDNAGDLTIDQEGLFDTLVTDGLATQTYVDEAIGNIDLTYTTDDVTEGVGNLYFTDGRAQLAAAAIVASGIKTDNAGPGGATRIVADTDVLATKTYAETVAGNAQDGAESYADSLASNYDAAGAASSAQTAAQNYADGLASNYDAAGAADLAEGAANEYTDTALESYTPTSSLDTTVGGYGYLKSADLSTYATQTYADDAADTAEGNANVYTNNLIGDVSVDGTAGNTVTDRIESAVASLVNGAPELLDTLNELAAAIGDDENYATTVSGLIADKQNNLTAGSNIDITSDTISVTGLDTDDVSEGENLYFTDERAIDAVSGADIYPNAVIIDNVAKQVAFTTGNITPAAATTALAWAKADYRSGKFTVKVKNGTHTEISEVLVTLDTSDNIAITEYGIVGTNGTLAAVTADVSGTDVRVRVTPVNDNSEVMVVGTLLI